MSNTTRYGVLIDGRRGGYGVVFPDLPGCREAPSTRLCGMPWRRPANGRKPRPRLRLDAHRAFIVEVAAGGVFTPDLGLSRALP